ncbi:MAG TPA: HPr-rel-A system PqqD family peptide chaperone [Chromatiaceae bacterium]|nr:HPr-rel-A system PqqD family peptide chaperone [Chromatiaceae bacterium]
MSESIEESLWQARPPNCLVWEIWEQDATVYDRSTGETHLLGPLPAEVLHLLGGTSMTLEDLSRKLADLCEVDCNDAWMNRTGRILADLALLSLVEKKPE